MKLITTSLLVITLAAVSACSTTERHVRPTTPPGTCAKPIGSTP